MTSQPQGVYVYDSNGKKYLDWTSEAVCVNLGHSIPDSVAWYKPSDPKEIEMFGKKGFKNSIFCGTVSSLRKILQRCLSAIVGQFPAILTVECPRELVASSLVSLYVIQLVQPLRTYFMLDLEWWQL